MSQAINQGTAIFTGRGVSPGTVLGPAVVLVPAPTETALRRLNTAEVISEQGVLLQAMARARADLKTLADHVASTVGHHEAGIFTAQALMLADPALADYAVRLITTEQIDAASAMQRAGDEQSAALHDLHDPLLQARAADVQDAVARVIRLVRAEAAPDLTALVAAAATPPVIVARDLAPSETVQLRADAIAGICLALGGPTAHAAILARALGIPAVVGLGAELLARVQPGDLVGVDADAGTVVVQPTEATQARLLAQAAQMRAQRATMQASARQWRGAQGTTRDGWRVIIAANVTSQEDALAARRDWGAEAIGLLRTEFLFAGRATLPDEDEQAELYARIFAAFADRAEPHAPVVARTLDAGADKPLPALQGIMAPEENPALGWRGIRLQLGQPDLLRTQARALLRAAGATHTPLHIMFPMIATLEELRTARAMVLEAQRHLRADGQPVPDRLPIGIMVETPAATWMADALAREADFLSIGTNDLTQYTMASDRLNPKVAALADPLQPAVLRAIVRVARAGQIAGRAVAVCGEMAGQPSLGALLVGLGVTELSMTPALIPAMKATLAGASYAALRRWADHALALTTLEEIRTLIAAGVPTE
jgi:phosphoenolpyruvate-protein phosphotransferase